MTEADQVKVISAIDKLLGRDRSPLMQMLDLSLTGALGGSGT